MITAYVDPGVHFSGVAWLAWGVLLHAEYRSACHPLSRDVHWTCEYTTVDWCVGEIPQVYSAQAKARMGKNVDDGDIIDLAYALGRMTSALPTRTLTPAEWKGSRNKKVMHARLLDPAKGILSPAELELLNRCLTGVRPSLRHNVYDAACMGKVLEGMWR